jgi:hypothetical protein
MTELDELASDIGVSGRTLRRAAARGTLAMHRSSPKKLSVPVAERVYLRARWQVLSPLIEVLRTLPNVRLAVLFGSVARGAETTQGSRAPSVDAGSRASFQ